MTTHQTGTRDQWLAARLDLLEAEKELTRRSDEVAQRRQELPWVRVDKPYRFDTDEGSASLEDLFRGRSQLLVYHFMFGPDYTAGCPSCSMIADGFNGFTVHLANHDVMLWAVRARRSPSCRRTGSAWAGPFRGRPRGRATSTPTSMCGSPSSSSAPAASTTTTGASRRSSGARARTAAPGGGPVRRHVRHRPRHLPARPAGPERVRARGRRRLPRLFDLRARRRRHLGRLPVARPRPERPQRDRRVVASPRRVRQVARCRHRI